MTSKLVVREFQSIVAKICKVGIKWKTRNYKRQRSITIMFTATHSGFFLLVVLLNKLQSVTLRSLLGNLNPASSLTRERPKSSALTRGNFRLARGELLYVYKPWAVLQVNNNLVLYLAYFTPEPNTMVKISQSKSTSNHRIGLCTSCIV